MTLQELVVTRQTARIALMATLVGWAVVGSARIVEAQQSAWESRGFVSVNGIYQATATNFSDNITFIEFVEQGDLDTRYKLDAGPLFDIGGTVRVWRNLGVGVNVSAFQRNDDASMTARIPHPFFFNRDRQISGSQGVKRKERAVHIQGIWVVPVSRSLEFAVYGGPTFFSVEQDLVTKVLFAHEYPYDSARFTGTNVDNRTKSKFGFNLGVDVGFYFSRNVGVGWLARFSRASINLPSEDDMVSVDAGGFQTGGGLRLRF